MMTALASAMNASITRRRRSVQTASFLRPRLCQELVRSMTHRAGLKWEALLADDRAAAELGEQVAGLGRVVAGVEMHGDLLGQTDAAERPT